MHAGVTALALVVGVSVGVGIKPPTYVPPTDQEKEDPAVRERLDRERQLIQDEGARGEPLDMERARGEAVEGVNAVLDSFHVFAARAMFEAYFALMHEDGVFLGTDASERWTKAEFMEYARPFMVEEGRGWEYRPRERRVSVGAGATVAWFDELLDHETYGVLRGSGVLTLTGAGWKIMQYNLAFTVPNESAPGVVELIRGGAGGDAED